MLLSTNDKKDILLDFPNIKLSYENIIHKKVYSDYYIAIPEGEKCFAWFTTYQNKNVCFILYLSLKKIEKNFETKQIIDIKIMNSCFNNNLCYNTIFYGTIFNQLDNSYFSIEDIFYYKGKNVSNFKWIDKLLLLNDLMKNNIKQITYNKFFIVFGLPLMNTNLDTLNIEITKLKYKINSIQFKMFNKFNTCFKLPITKNYNYELSCDKTPELNKEYIKNEKYEKYEINKKNIKKESIFKIKPDIQNDIYYLYCLDNSNNLILYDVAYIPDYKTSVFMNKLFRNIKENDNLDKLEESDDEEEFENESKNRFVFLDKEYNMICLYNNKFKKWYPIKLALKNQQLTKYCDISN